MTFASLVASVNTIFAAAAVAAAADGLVSQDHNQGISVDPARTVPSLGRPESSRLTCTKHQGAY